MEIIIIGAILLFVLLYNQTIDGQKFIRDNEKYFQMLKEDDYEFLVYAKYGESEMLIHYSTNESLMDS